MDQPAGVVVNLRDGTRRQVRGVGQELNGGALSSDGTRLAVCTTSSELLVYDLTSEPRVLWRTPIGQADAQVAPVFGMSDRYVIAGRNGQELAVFDATTGRLVRSIVRSGRPLVQLDTDGTSYVLAYDHQQLAVYDLRDFRRVRLIETGDDLKDAFAVTPLVTRALLLRADGQEHAVVYDFDHAADARVLELSRRAPHAAASQPTADLTASFALYGLDAQFAAALARHAPVAASHAPALARRRLGVTTDLGSNALPPVLPGTKILLALD
jgi:hypothetical protein